MRDRESLSIRFAYGVKALTLPGKSLFLEKRAEKKEQKK